MLKSGIKIIDKKGLKYIAKNGNDVKNFKPWIGDVLSFLYDFIMENSSKLEKATR